MFHKVAAIWMSTRVENRGIAAALLLRTPFLFTSHAHRLGTAWAPRKSERTRGYYELWDNISPGILDMKAGMLQMFRDWTNKRLYENSEVSFSRCWRFSSKLPFSFQGQCFAISSLIQFSLWERKIHLNSVFVDWISPIIPYSSVKNIPFSQLISEARALSQHCIKLQCHGQLNMLVSFLSQWVMR